MGQRAVIYCRVSTADQSCSRQERDLASFAKRADYEVVGTYKETASGVKLDRVERRKVLALAQRHEIDAVLVTELSRWGRSTTDLLASLKELDVDFRRDLTRVFHRELTRPDGGGLVRKRSSFLLSPLWVWAFSPSCS